MTPLGSSILLTPQAPLRAPTPVLSEPLGRNPGNGELGLPHVGLMVRLDRGSLPQIERQELPALEVFPQMRAIPNPPLARINSYEPPPRTPSALFESMVRQLLADEKVRAARRLLQALPSGASETQSL